MAQANGSLSPHDSTFYLASGAVTLALYRSRQAVKDAIRRKGEKVSAYPACEITAMAKASCGASRADSRGQSNSGAMDARRRVRQTGAACTSCRTHN